MNEHFCVRCRNLWAERMNVLTNAAECSGAKCSVVRKKVNEWSEQVADTWRVWALSVRTWAGMREAQKKINYSKIQTCVRKDKGDGWWMEKNWQGAVGGLSRCAKGVFVYLRSHKHTKRWQSGQADDCTKRWDSFTAIRRHSCVRCWNLFKRQKFH